MFEFFAVLGGISLYLWAAIFAFSCFLIYLIDEGIDGDDANWGGSSVAIIISFIVLHFAVPTLSIWYYAIQNPWGLINHILFYLAAGVIWSYVKWGLFVNKRYEAFKKGGHKASSFKFPTAAAYKGDIMGWMAFWPWSALWSLINDPIRRLFNTLFNLLSETYDAISRWRFREYDIHQ